LPNAGRINKGMRYVLEVQSWAEWSVERKFDSLEIARLYGKERFSHNTWRIVDHFAAGEVVFLYDPTIAFEQQANLDIQRFERTDRWMAQRDSPPRVAQRQRMGQIATRQRTSGRSQYLRDMLDISIEELVGTKKPKMQDKVDWKNEGF
jgi:hypothetical protein